MRIDGTRGTVLRRFACCALAAASLPLASQTAAQADTLCHYDAPTHQMSILVDPGWLTALVEASPDGTFFVVLMAPGGQQTLSCDGATNTTVDSISATGSPGTVVDFDASRAPFAPGLTAELTGQSEIELSASGFDVVAYDAPISDPATLTAGRQGVAVNADGDADLSVGAATTVEVFGSRADDVISAGGGYGTGQALAPGVTFAAYQPGPLTVPNGDDTLIGHKGPDRLSLRGSSSGTATGLAGDDVLTGGSLGGPYTLDAGAGNDGLIAAGGPTELLGGAGNDTFSLAGNDHALGGRGDDLFMATGGLIDVVDGGQGSDVGTFDPFDIWTKVEQALVP